MLDSELEARLLADPDDHEAYLVYADVLQRRGDPRGDLIAVQVRLAQTPDDSELRAREAELLKTHGVRWLGSLARATANDLAVTWRYGFVHAIRIGPPLDSHDATDLDVRHAIAPLSVLPGMAFMRELVIGAVEDGNVFTSWSPVIAALAEYGLPPNVTRLAFHCGGQWPMSTTSLGDLTPAYPQLQRVCELEIRMGSMELGSIEMPELRALSIVTNGLTASNVRSVHAVPRPRLERLVLYLGEYGHRFERDVEIADLGPIFDATNLSGVRHLALANSSIVDAIAGALASSKILSQLETLDLSRGTMTDAGARSILANAGAFAHLRELDLTHAYLGDEVRAQLATLGPRVILDDPQWHEDDYRVSALHFE